jgi:D-alanine transaminase
MDDLLVYLDGVMTPLSEAKIPVLDRGFIFGDGIYDVIPFYAGRPLRAAEHMARLFRSLDAIKISNPHTKEEWMALVNQVVAASGPHDQLVYIQVTRGVAPRRHAFPAVSTPTVFIMSNPQQGVSDTVLENGIACVTMVDQRWLHCEIKSISLLGNVLAAQYAAEHDVAEAIQFRDDFLTEGSSSNVWVVKDGVVSGPPKDNLILEGIRYGLVQDLCAACGIPFAMRRIARAEVFAADELLVTSAGKEIVAATTLDGKTIGSGKPGPVFSQLYAAYQDAKLGKGVDK